MLFFSFFLKRWRRFWKEMKMCSSQNSFWTKIVCYCLLLFDLKTTKPRFLLSYLYWTRKPLLQQIQITYREMKSEKNARTSTSTSQIRSSSGTLITIQPFDLWPFPHDLNVHLMKYARELLGETQTGGAAPLSSVANRISMATERDGLLGPVKWRPGCA